MSRVWILDGKDYVGEAAELLSAVFIPCEALDALKADREWRVAVNANGDVLGFICYEQKLTYMYWDLCWMAVDGATRGMGIGRMLVDYMKAEVIRENGSGTIRVETPCDSEARGFYEACGFELAAIYPDFYEEDRGVCVYLWHY